MTETLLVDVTSNAVPALVLTANPFSRVTTRSAPLAVWGVVAAAPVATLASRFALIGVLSGRNSGGGAALIAVDGKPAKPFRVGAAVDEGLVLQALGPRQAQLGRDADGPATLTLDMPLKR